MVDIVNEFYDKTLPEMFAPTKIEISRIPSSEILNKATTAIAAGEAPDVMFIDQPTVAALLSQNALLPMPEDLLDPVAEFGARTAAELTLDGKIYMLPQVRWGKGMIYNAELLDQAGFSPSDVPTVWKDLLPFAEKLTKRDSAGNVTQSGFATTNGGEYDVRTTLLSNLGGFWFKDAMTSEWDTPECFEAWRFTKELVTKHHLDNAKADSVIARFNAGKVALMQNQSYVAADAYIQVPAMRGKVGQLPGPTFNGKGPRGHIEMGAGYAVLTQSKDAGRIKDAWALWKVMLESVLCSATAWQYSCIPARLEAQRTAPPWNPKHWWKPGDPMFGSVLSKVTTPGEESSAGFFAKQLFTIEQQAWDAYAAQGKDLKSVLADAAGAANAFLKTSPGSQKTLLSRESYAKHPEWSAGKVPIKPWWNGESFG